MTTLYANTEQALNLDIYYVDQGFSGGFATGITVLTNPTIVLTANITLSSSLSALKNTTILDGGANRYGIDAHGLRGLVVQGGRVTLEDTFITNATALGATGGAGGGGGGGGGGGAL